MTDAELIARLREYREINEGSTGVSYDPIPECLAAADRIEALIAERDYLATSVDKAVARMYAAEDKLAKAVEVLEQCEIMLRLRGHDKVAAIARATLAEIKGESHD